jgi:hypothetical protein
MAVVHIKVCVVQKDNPRSVYRELLKRAGLDKYDADAE